MRGPPRKGRPAALAASPCPHCAAMRERGEGAKRLEGGASEKRGAHAEELFHFAHQALVRQEDTTWSLLSSTVELRGMMHLRLGGLRRHGSASDSGCRRRVVGQTTHDQADVHIARQGQRAPPCGRTTRGALAVARAPRSPAPRPRPGAGCARPAHRPGAHGPGTRPAWPARATGQCRSACRASNPHSCAG